jgi:hypothetical protein
MRDTAILEEMARLRWVEGKKLGEIALYLNLSRSTVQRGLRNNAVTLP